MKKSKLIFTFFTAAVLMLITAISVSAAYRGDTDLDYELSASDARLALRASVGLETLDPEQEASADVDGSGRIEASDARMILRASVGLEKMYERYYLKSEIVEENEEIYTVYYRPDGQILKEILEDKNGNTAIRDYRYDSYGRLTGMRDNSGRSVTFTISKTKDGYVSNSQENSYLHINVYYDNNCRITEFDNLTAGTAEVYDENGRVKKRIFFNPGAANPNEAVFNKVIDLSYFGDENLFNYCVTRTLENGEVTNESEMELYMKTDKKPFYIESYENGELYCYQTPVYPDEDSIQFNQYDPEGNLMPQFINLYYFDKNGNPSKDVSCHRESDGEYYIHRVVTYDYALYS